MSVVYTEDDETSGRISTNATVAPLTVWIKGWETGDATVLFEYSSDDICEVQGGCRSCGDFECKDDWESWCDGSGFPRCSPEDEAITNQNQCDDYRTPLESVQNPNHWCAGKEIELPPCRQCYLKRTTHSPTTVPTTAPTSGPTGVPTTEPTTAPTSRPTSWPTTEPSTAPSTAPTTSPTTEPTWAPTYGNCT
eukprot:UN24926